MNNSDFKWKLMTVDSTSGKVISLRDEEFGHRTSQRSSISIISTTAITASLLGYSICELCCLKTDVLYCVIFNKMF